MVDNWNELQQALVAFFILFLTVVGAAVVMWLKAYFDLKRKELEDRLAKQSAQTAVLSVEEDARTGAISPKSASKLSTAVSRTEEKLESLGLKPPENTVSLVQEQVRQMKSWGLESQPDTPTPQPEATAIPTVLPFAGQLPDGEPVGAGLSISSGVGLRSFSAAPEQPSEPLPRGGYAPGGDI